MSWNSTTNTWSGRATDEMFGAMLPGNQTLTNIHAAWRCKGRGCSIHHPSDHHMQDWDMVWRGDKGMFERHCKHWNEETQHYDYGPGHPDPDDVAYHKSQGRDWAGVHGCDGCCLPSPSVSASTNILCIHEGEDGIIDNCLYVSCYFCDSSHCPGDSCAA